MAQPADRATTAGPIGNPSSASATTSAAGSLTCIEQTINTAKALIKDRDSVHLISELSQAALDMYEATDALAEHKSYMLFPQKAEISPEDVQQLQDIYEDFKSAFKVLETKFYAHESTDTPARLVAGDESISD